MSDCSAAVSASLEECLASSAKATLQAIGAQEAAVQAITQHIHKLKEAMEAEVHGIWVNLCGAKGEDSSGSCSGRAGFTSIVIIFDFHHDDDKMWINLHCAIA